MSEEAIPTLYGISYDVRESCPECGGKELYELKASRQGNQMWFLCINKKEMGDNRCPSFPIVIE